MTSLKKLAVATFALCALALGVVSPAHAQVKVTAATPSSTYQGTVSLDVVVNGSGFDNSAKAQFFVTGTTNPGGVTVKKIQFHNSKELVATIDVSDTATIAGFDVVVTLDGGRKGKGTNLFTVQSKNLDPCAQLGLDFPAFTYWVSTAKGPQVYVADATGKCSRLVYEMSSSAVAVGPGSGAFRYPIAGTTDVGRVTWREGDGGIYGLTFRVTGTSIAVSARELIYDTAPVGLIDTDLNKDGTVVYASLDSGGGTGSARIIAVNISDRTQNVVFTGPADGTDIGHIAANDDGVLFASLSARVANAGVDNPLLRIVPPCAELSCATVLASAPTGTHGNDFPSTSRIDDRLAYSYYLPGFVGCWLLQIIPDTGGAILNSGQPRYGMELTWYKGKILTNGIKAPAGNGRCSATGMITQIDPDTSAETPLVKGNDPHGR